MNADFFRGVLLKMGFKGTLLRRAQAALIYAALSGEAFTADVLPKEIVGDDTTIAGVAVGSLATMKLIERVDRVKSPSKTRNGAWVNRWRIATGRADTARAWLHRNGYPTEEQPEMSL